MKNIFFGLFKLFLFKILFKKQLKTAQIYFGKQLFFKTNSQKTVFH